MNTRTVKRGIIASKQLSPLENDDVIFQPHPSNSRIMEILVIKTTSDVAKGKKEPEKSI